MSLSSQTFYLTLGRKHYFCLLQYFSFVFWYQPKHVLLLKLIIIQNWFYSVFSFGSPNLLIRYKTFFAFLSKLRNQKSFIARMAIITSYSALFPYERHAVMIITQFSFFSTPLVCSLFSQKSVITRIAILTRNSTVFPYRRHVVIIVIKFSS